MGKINNSIFAIGLFALASSAQAVIIDFAAMANGAGGYGESVWDPLSLSETGFAVDITGTDLGNDAYAYLDAGTGGLGVCKRLNSAGLSSLNSKTGSGSNLCWDSSDDNVTYDEALHFVFTHDVVISNIWFNNNHDGGLGTGDKATIEGTAYDIRTGYAGGTNGVGVFNVGAGDSFDIKFNNEQFYISAMEIRARQVPEPASLALLGMALAGVGFARRRKK